MVTSVRPASVQASSLTGRARPSLRAAKTSFRVPAAATEEQSEPTLTPPSPPTPLSKPDIGKAGKRATQEASTSGITVEYQRTRAKEMRKYFQDLKLEEATKAAQVFGWTKANEIGNGRWVMFGLAVGILTEYSTGLSFVDQILYTISVLGIADVYE